MRVQWNEMHIRGGNVEYITREANSPAILDKPYYDAASDTWRVPVQADPGTAFVDIRVNDAIVSISLDAQGRGEVSLANIPGTTYEVAVVGAPEIVSGMPVPGCIRTLEV